MDQETEKFVETSRSHILVTARTRVRAGDIKNGFTKREEVDANETQLKLREIKEKAKTNPWYHVDFKIKGALLSFCGKFHADLKNAKDSNTIDLGGFDFPEFTFDKTKEELGNIVENWMKRNPEGENHEEVQVQADNTEKRIESFEEKQKRKEEMERKEMEEEEAKGITRVYVICNFSDWGMLSKEHLASELKKGELTAFLTYKNNFFLITCYKVTTSCSNEALRGKVANIISKILNKMLIIGHSYGIRFVFNEINLSQTEASMRSIFNGEDWKGNIIYREREVSILHLSHTQTSTKSLQNLSKLVRLEYLYLDDCPFGTKVKRGLESCW